MSKWSFTELLNIDDSGHIEEYAEIYLSPYDVEPSERNFYSQEDIEELADSMLAVGQQQPTVLGLVDGKYRIISGHRRNLANIHNMKCGELPTNYKARYLYKDMSSAMFELSLLVGNAFNRKLTPYEETEQTARLKAALIRARDEDGMEIRGKMRDIVADILKTSKTEVARMDKINSGLVPEAKEQFKEGRIGKSAAYETAKLPAEEQRKIAAAAAEGKDIKNKDIAERVKKKQEEKKIEKIAKCAEQVQMGLEAERAEENVNNEGTTEWSINDWAMYTLREIMILVDYINEGDVEMLQNILMSVTERMGEKNENIRNNK